jgi:N-formylglutamate amidohydrolase
MSETAAADGANEPAGAASTPSGFAARDLDPVTVSDTMFDDPGYSPLDLYDSAQADAGDLSAPVVASCPHAGRSYPASMLAASKEPVSALRGLEDFGVDCLLPGLAAAGVTTVVNRFSRAYIDVNRDPAAVDSSMFSAPVSTRPPCQHVRAGYGLIPRLTATRKPIYAGKLDPTEISTRLGNVHTPYHAALTSMMDQAVSRFGKVLLIDMHSMPAFDRLNNRLADIICGDGFGTTLDRDMADAITGFFRDRGFSIDWNHPYAGGFITREYGKADSQRQAVQIEINRGLYMDGSTRLNQPRVAGLRDTIAEFGQCLTSHCRGTV